MASPLKHFESIRSFTPDEAWKVYRLAAFAEAIGWSVLISGLLVSHYGLVPRDIALPIAGQIHGMIFIAYFVALFFTYPSLGWSRTNTVTAFLAGVPPYGSLIFEACVSKQRKKKIAPKGNVYLVIRNKGETLAMQPSKGQDWKLPCSQVASNESPTSAAQRLTLKIFGKTSKLALCEQFQNDYLFEVKDQTRISAADLINYAAIDPAAEEFVYIDSSDAPKLITTWHSNN